MNTPRIELIQLNSVTAAAGVSPFKGMLKVGQKMNKPVSPIQKQQLSMQPNKIYNKTVSTAKNTTAIKPVNTTIPTSTQQLKQKQRDLHAFGRRQANLNKKSSRINNAFMRQMPKQPKYKPMAPKPL